MSFTLPLFCKYFFNTSVIIVGKCADDILRNYSNVISVYIEAPRAACVKSIMEKLHVSQKRANRLISETDKYRAKYYNYYTSKKWGALDSYDLFVNSSLMSLEKTVDYIVDYINLID